MIFLLFVLAIVVRLLYFPHNIYFGFDQARDAFTALEIIHGHLKIIGPSTSFPGLFHGVAYDYLVAPIYFLGKGNPEIVAVFLRILNATGIFLIFYLGKILFNRKVGLIAAALFAVSFEETQFAIYMGNPAPAVLSVGLMFLGLAMVIFKKNYWGFPLSLLGLGLSIQFEFGLFYLIIPWILIFLIFRKDFLRTPLKFYLWSAISLLISLSSFLVVELKFNFKTIHGLLALAGSGSSKDFLAIIQTYLFSVSRMLAFNLVADLPIGLLVGGLLLLSLIWFGFSQKDFRKQLIFLSCWFFSLVITDIVSGGVKNLQITTPLYYPNIGISLSLLIFVAFLISRIKFWGWALLLVIIMFNINMIYHYNAMGTISEIDVQQGMLLSSEKAVLDYLYTDANSQPFAVKAVTMPLFINTTWSYLFDWYGQGKYGYLPIWNGKNAEGFPGSLVVEEAQEKLPPRRYLIIEPTRGVPQYLIDDYLREENYFTKVIDQKNLGDFMVQKRQRY